MGDRKYGLITEEDIQNIHVMSEFVSLQFFSNKSDCFHQESAVRPHPCNWYWL